MVHVAVVCMEGMCRRLSQTHWSSAEMLVKNQERDWDVKSIQPRWSQTQAHPFKISLWFCEIKDWVTICFFEHLLRDVFEKTWQNPVFTVFKHFLNPYLFRYGLRRLMYWFLSKITEGLHRSKHNSSCHPWDSRKFWIVALYTEGIPKWFFSACNHSRTWKSEE